MRLTGRECFPRALRPPSEIGITLPADPHILGAAAPLEFLERRREKLEVDRNALAQQAVGDSAKKDRVLLQPHIRNDLQAAHLLTAFRRSAQRFFMASA